METTLVSGRFSIREADELVCKLYEVKRDFHMSRIDTRTMSEEDVKHSEKRILELESQLKELLNTIRSGRYRHVALNAKIVLELCPDYQGA